jgi:hypothetical protein
MSSLVSVVSKVVGIFATMIVLLLISVPLFSQGNAGRILGVVTDQSGGAIVGVTVTVTDTQRGVTRPLTTDAAGEYNAPNLIPGTYTVHAEAKGFKSIQRQNIILEVNQDLRVDFQLQPGDVTQTITVTEAIPLVETTNAELGGTLPSEVIDNLPLNGRNFTNLLQLRPGVMIYPGGGAFTQSTDGMRYHDNVYLVDGVNTDDPWAAQPSMNAGGVGGDAETILPIDAIEEFKSEVNPRAEYGWKPGAVVNVGIKSGTNSLHGTAYAYGRSSAFDARDYFNPASGPQVDTALEQFGATLGGHIKKDKLFYFASYEDQRYLVGNPAGHTIPVSVSLATSGNPAGDPAHSLVDACTAARSAVSTGGTFAPLSANLAGLSPTTCLPVSGQPTIGFQGLFPVNNGPGTSVTTNLDTTNQVDGGLIKIDYHPNDQHTVTGFFFYGQGNGLFVDNPFAQVATPWLTIQSAKTHVAAGTWTWTPNSSWVNEARVGYSSYYQVFLSNDSTDNPASYKFNGSTYNFYTGQTNPAYFGLPEITFNSFGPTFSLGASWPKYVGPDKNVQILDHVSYLHGKHAFKFGGEILLMQNPSNVSANAKGPIKFSTLESFFQGIPFSANFLSGNLQRNMSSRGYAAFVQDDWRVTARLMLNLGLRYEVDTVPTEAHNLLGNFDPAAPTGLVQDAHGTNSPYNGDHNNFSPRLGLAWDVSGNGKTVIRAGASLVYEQLSNDVLNNLGNFLGLRTVPTGVNLYVNGAQIASPGTINVSDTIFTGTAANGTTTPGQIAYDWIHNGPSTASGANNQSLYHPTPACGDGNQVILSSGLTILPQPCTIVGVNRNLRIPYVTLWTLGIQRALAANTSVEIAYVGDHGTKLISVNDLNAAPLGSGWTTQATAACLASAPTYGNCAPDSAAEVAARPFVRQFPYMKNILFFSNGDTSNYNGLQATLTQRTSHGLSFTAGYTYSHSLDNASDNWGVLFVPLSGNNRSLYASSDTDIRNRATLSVTYTVPGKKGFGQIFEGWSLNSVVILQSSLPWWAQDGSNDFSGTGEVNLPFGIGQLEQWTFVGNPADFQQVHGFTTYNGNFLEGGAGGLPHFSGTTPDGSAVNPSLPAACIGAAGGAGNTLAYAALVDTGCYVSPNGRSVLVPPAYGTIGKAGRNTFRDGGYKNWDFSLTKEFKFKERLTVQFRAEIFNVLNHVTFANPYGAGGRSNNDPSSGAGFACGCATADTLASNSVLGSGGPRDIQLGLKLRW